MAGPKKRGCLGCSFPVLIIVVIIALAILVIGFLAGPLGKNIVGDIGLPSWLSVPAPEPHLPAPVLFHVLGLPITNTVIAGWVTVIFLVLVSWLITRRMKLVPGKLQAAFEFILGWIYDFCKSVAGEEYGRKFFPVICTIFLFVMFNAWLSLIPGFGSIEIIVHGHEYELLRGANTDVNTPLAIALVSFVFVEYYGLKTLGIKYLRKFINMGGFFRSIGNVFRGKPKKGLSGLFSGFIDIFVGGLETLSELIRIVSFTFRLFGNMTAGEILIMVAAFLIPMAIGWMVYGLELFIGFIQALVFSGLTLAFAAMAVTSHEEEAH
ncbi:MAG: ATP synthase F0 subunit A [Chloroflexi bacterium RBG_13_51_18]|nr:MAG: ATP synthase F0 subunit A [Chloroflexi bacterium RBG_13_51_18]